MPHDSFNLLIVCVANICRSPAFELMLLQGFDGRSRLDRREVDVGSAGWMARPGVPLAPRMAQALRAGGFEAPLIGSRPVDSVMLERADLTLVATRDLRSAVVRERPSRLPSTFTIREFARYCSLLLEEGEGLPPTGQGERLRHAVAFAQANRGTVVPNRPDDDDVLDPYGRSRRAYRNCVRTLRSAAAPVLTVAGARTRVSEH